MITNIIIALAIFILIPLISLIKIRIELYFLKFKFNNHPYLKNIIENELYGIANNEGVPVFELPFDDVNENKIRSEDDKASGVYIHASNPKNKKYLSNLKKAYQNILELENDFGEPYEKLYYSVYNENPPLKKREYCVPRIEIGLFDKPSHFSEIYKYKTFAHELGHHFAITRENDESEERADEIAKEIIVSKLPNYFKLIYCFIFHDYKPLNSKEFYKLIWSYYWNYYRKRKTLNKNI